MASPPRQVRRFLVSNDFQRGEPENRRTGEPDSNSVQFRVQDHRGIYGELLRKSEGLNSLNENWSCLESQTVLQALWQLYERPRCEFVFFNVSVSVSNDGQEWRALKSRSCSQLQQEVLKSQGSTESKRVGNWKCWVYYGIFPMK